MMSLTSSVAIVPLSYQGDPTIRGLAGAPTLMTPTDVAQGVGGNTISSILANQSSVLTNQNNISGGGGSLSLDGGDVVSGIVNAGIKQATTQLAGSSPSSGSASSGSSSGAVDCSSVSFWGHPIDAITCSLDRGLFGLLGVLVLGIGLFLLFSDTDAGQATISAVTKAVA